MRDKLPESGLSIYWPRRLAWLAAVAVGSLGLAGLSGCATQNGSSAEEYNFTVPDNAPQLTQARQWLDAGEFGNAGLQLQQLDPTLLQPAARAEWHLLSAEVALDAGVPDAAEAHLEHYQRLINSVTTEQEHRGALLGARLLELRGNYLEAARERDFISGVLTDENRSDNERQLWEDLMQMPEAELQEWAQKVPDSRFGQWLTLAAVSRSYHLTLDEQLQGVRDWRASHPGHPAAQNLPGALSLLENIAASRPDSVALLLPLSGRLARTGEAIRDGFMAAYFESLQKGYPVPRITVMDNAMLDSMDQAYAQAIQAGSQWLVGPVSKNDVQTLTQATSLPLPTLALNYGERTETTEQAPPEELFQFGLAAEDEAAQIAEKAWQDGRRRALVMVPEGSWGERINSAFAARWLELGGEIEETRFYPRAKDYNPQIKALLNVDDSQNRYRTIRGLMRQTMEFEPRRRQDADWIFLVALPDQARQIKPTLAFNFAGDLPVYATSHVYSGERDPSRDRDLNGIMFCDAPWLLRSSELKSEIDAAISGGEGGYARLYAMGVDAFRLVARVKQLEAFPDSRIYGSTGALTLDNQRRIHRETECTRFRAGSPVQLAAD
ncbi:penicillin-binding protein activator [uncultured Thalassolituus sp.]|uniref:penicillin-binding protein activator n=2 Tax=uncultured Thalassolituus sp. TaxID=285273 RepID=UPI00261C04A7|nr:penicillin-binding protein activator [uncultured Thalassolituus sp.]